MTQIALLWHMHQPYYEDLVTGEHILPWVRLHALKDYFGMVALLGEFPRVKATFNLVPSLLVQLEAFAAGRAHDRYLELGLKPAAALGADDAVFLLQNFFHAQRQRMIEPYPRYAELLARRGVLRSAADARAAARRFAVEDLRDLQVWQKLAWIDPFYLERDPRVRGLVQQGEHFTEDDKALLRTIELELLNAVVPAYREAADRGQVELSTSPFYHPILPLLCDSEVYLHTHPQARTPRRPFRRPADAADQLARAVACHARVFGHRPAGVWPSEGSVSDEMVPLVARAGFEWMATDELILARTLGMTFTRDPLGHLDQPDRLYLPYAVRAGGSRVAALFRDHTLSDLIGFTYAGWQAEPAAEDFVSRLIEAGRRYTTRGGRGEPVVPIILDGENAWEHFEGGGRPFLRALYARLSGHPELRTVTMREACRETRAELPGIFPGSWIDANFSIWIGHPDDQRAWSQLGDACEALDAAHGGDAAALERAREEILIAEGSDWFWWYGDDHSSEHDLEFDDLFRRHLRNVYGLLQKPVPAELFVSNISVGMPTLPDSDPTGLLAPTLDGDETSYFEWLGAGCLDLRAVAGAMHQTDRRPALLTRVHYGFDRDRLFVRLDGAGAVADLLAEGYAVSLEFLRPEGLKFTVRHEAGAAAGAFWERRGEAPHWMPRGPGRAAVAAGQVLEVAVPIADLGTRRLSFFVTVHEGATGEVERHPASRPIDAEAPDARFEARNWTA